MRPKPRPRVPAILTLFTGTAFAGCHVTMVPGVSANGACPWSAPQPGAAKVKTLPGWR